METKVDEIVQSLCNSMKLERDKGLMELERTLPNLNVLERRQLMDNFSRLLTDSLSSWEAKHSSLLGSKSLIFYLNLEDDADCNFIFLVKQISLKLLTDTELRLRLAAGEVLGCLCKKVGVEIYKESKDVVLKSFQCNIEWCVWEDDSFKVEPPETGNLAVGPSSDNRVVYISPIYRERSEWNNLETSLKVLQLMIEGCGLNFQPFIDEELLSLIFKTLTHANRFVRASGFFVCSSLFSCGSTNDDSEVMESVSAVNPIFAFGHEFCKYLSKGLADNWSQVRFAASVATRNFLLSLPKNESRELFYPELLPRMCLNRYYAADGIRIYSQETWRQVMGTAGKELVEQHIEPTVEYYSRAITSLSHVIKEAACASIAELASKISKECVRPYVDTLLNILLHCFRENSWQVRDAACLACGNLVLSFPNESSTVMNILYSLFFQNLSDSIPSVRQGAAYALTCVVRAYGITALQMVFSYVTQCLRNVKNQQPDIEKNSDSDSRFGLVSRITDNYVDFDSDGLNCKTISAHSPQESSPGINYEKKSQPWEAADGCVYFIGEVSHVTESHDKILSIIPLLKNAGRYRHYANHVIFMETICKQIPMLAKNLGEKVFKNIVEEFFDIIFYSLECENALTSSAASQCLSYIATLLGPNILRLKVRNFNPNYGKCLESVIHLAPY